jgi:hypothetical protein
MAVLTTLARLLETTVVALEGEGGTGPLEADVALLEDDAAGRSPLPPTHRACVAYRAGQKRAARLWLVEALDAVHGIWVWQDEYNGVDQALDEARRLSLMLS